MQAKTVFERRGRDRLSIIAEILEVTLDGSLKTQIMYRANLSFVQLNGYLSLLLDWKLMERTETKEKTVYKTTPKGIWFLKAYRDIKNLLTTESVEEAFRKASVVAVIPVYNEEANLAKVILSLRKYVDRIIVCDDASTDRTAEIAESMGAKVVRHDRTMGYGAALRSLFETAGKLEADVIITLNGDGQHDPDKVPALIRPILEGHVDVVVASPVEKERTNIPLYRRLGLKAFNKLLKIITRNEMSDAQYGFRAYGRKALEDLEISENGISVGAEVLMKARKLGLKVVEVPVGLGKTRIKVTEK